MLPCPSKKTRKEDKKGSKTKPHIDKSGTKVKVESKTVDLKKRVPVRLITETIKEAPKEKVLKPVTKKLCTIEAHHCLAIDLTNRILSMLNEFENNMDSIGKHPTISDDTKSDIQNYINKNIVTGVWVLQPAFDLIKDLPEFKKYKMISDRICKSGGPGVLSGVKRI